MKTNSKNHPQKTHLQLTDNPLEAPQPHFLDSSATLKLHLHLRFYPLNTRQKTQRRLGKKNKAQWLIGLLINKNLPAQTTPNPKPNSQPKKQKSNPKSSTSETQRAPNMHPHPQPKKTNITPCTEVKQNISTHNQTNQKTQTKTQTQPKTQPKK